MSDLHPLPLVGHDLDGPTIRAKVFSTSPAHWYWSYEYDYGEGPLVSVLRHGPFASQAEAFTSARHAAEVA